MNLITPEQHARALRYLPEVRQHHLLTYQILGYARALDNTKAEEERIVRESNLTNLLNTLSDQWTKLAMLGAISDVAEALTLDPAFKAAMESSDIYEGIIDRSRPLAERISLLRGYEAYKLEISLAHGAKPHLEKIGDVYHYGGEPVVLFLTSFVWEFDALVRIAVRTYRSTGLKATDQRLQLSHLSKNYLSSIYAALYELTGSVVQILSIAPELELVLQERGLKHPEYLRSFVLDYLGNQGLHKAMENLLRAQGHIPVEIPKELPSS